MSYTPPTYVDTKEQAILALASTIADEDKRALGNGSVNRALDVLADVLAQQDVQVPQTNAGAILALAQYAQGGGGGGGTAHSITCKRVVDMETGETEDIPSMVSVAVLGENGWGQADNPEHIDEAVGGTILYAGTYTGPGLPTIYPYAMGTVNPQAQNPLGADIIFYDAVNNLWTFPMADEDIVVVYIPR